jgi:hypothetical protein
VSRCLAMGIHVIVCKMVSQVDRNVCGERIRCPNAFEIETGMFLELSLSEPHSKHALLA